jgi:PKD repeat protein
MAITLRSCTRLAILAGILVGTLGVASSASAAAGDIGYRDQSYAPLGGSPSGTKPESKLWFNDGSWWGDLFNGTDHKIFKLNRTTGVWSDTGVTLDPRDSSRSDILWTGTKLYVASHMYTTSGSTTTSGNVGRLYRYSYNGTTYTLDSGFPVNINANKTETLVIDRDSTGTLWSTFTSGSRVYVNHSVGGNDAAWSTPILVPGSTALTSDDISSLIQFGGNKIGLMWSNQVDHKVYFAVHNDGAADTAWTTSAVPNGGATSDDHINLKADSAGRVYAAVKTSDTGSKPLIQLLTRSAAGTWANTTFGTGSNSHTRPIVELDAEHGVLHMFATCPQPPSTSGQSGGDICEKTATAGDSPSFGPGIGTAIIREAGSPDMNDATSTKQNVSSSTGLVVLANNKTSKLYWHSQDSLGGGSPPPAGPKATFNANPQSGTEPLNVQFTNTSTGGPFTSISWTFGDGGTSTAANPSHQFAAGTWTVSLTVTNANGSDTTSGQITVSPAGGGGGGGGTPSVFMATEDAQVKSTSPSTKYGADTTVRVRQGASPTDVFYHTYLRFVVGGLSGSVTSAKLRLFVTDASKDGGTVYTVASSPTWSQSTITWNTAPALVTPITPLGVTAAVGAWEEVDVTSAITGNGTFDLGLQSASTDSAIYSSREGSQPPQLVVTTG